MDIRMPVMDGHAATKRIKSTPGGQKTIIVALTAVAFEEDREAMLADGCDDFVRKPFREEDIFGVLAKYLNVRFKYEESDKEEVEGRKIHELEERLRVREALATMPSDWLVDMRQAAIEGDLGWMTDLIAEIHKYDQGSQNVALAEALAELVQNFEFEKVLQLIGQTAGS